mgnify:CR=1 FL=1
MNVESLIHEIKVWITMRQKHNLDCKILQQTLIKLERLKKLESITKEFTVDY